MGLIISRRTEESYYLFIHGPVAIGDYIKITHRNGYDRDVGVGKEDVVAPENILILREEIVKEIGGLENIVKQIKEGTFKFRWQKWKVKNKKESW